MLLDQSVRFLGIEIGWVGFVEYERPECLMRARLRWLPFWICTSRLWIWRKRKRNLYAYKIGKVDIDFDFDFGVGLRNGNGSKCKLYCNR